LYRYSYGTYQSKKDAIRNLGTVLRKGYWDAFVRKSLRGERTPANQLLEKENYYTIQVMALRNARSLNYFENLGSENLKMYKGKDGLSRYTFNSFSSIDSAKSRLDFVIKKGYLDAFTREIKWYNEH
jgi:hypothetical protein